MLKGSDASFGFPRPRASNSWTCNAELLVGITAEVLLDEGRSKTIETGSHRRVGGKEITRPRDRQRDVEWLARFPP